MHSCLLGDDMAIQEGAGNVPQQTFVRWNDPSGTQLVAINRDGTVYTQGIEYPDGTTQETGSVPVISDRIQVLNATTPLSFELTTATTEMYTVSLYMSAVGTAAAGHYVLITIAYTCELGPETITIELALDHQGIIMETYPLLVIGGTSVSISTSYAGGATNDPYNISARIVEMP
jgi:hypothetical protein